MSENAVLAEDPNMPPLEVAEPETLEAESAPVEQEETPAEPKEDGIQKRINKITADKYAEKRRADELERKLAEMQSQAPQVSTDTPKLEDFDFDEGKFQDALIDHKVNLKAATITQQQREAMAREAQAQKAQAFNVKVAEFATKVPDYQEVVGNIPMLPQDTLDAVMQSEKGVEIAYYLGKHLDVADEIASSSPMVAAMKLGELSAKLSATKPAVKTSTAPSPIEPISSGGAVSKDIAEMSMEEIYNLQG